MCFGNQHPCRVHYCRSDRHYRVCTVQYTSHASLLERQTRNHRMRQAIRTLVYCRLSWFKALAFHTALHYNAPLVIASDTSSKHMLRRPKRMLGPCQRQLTSSTRDFCSWNPQVTHDHGPRVDCFRRRRRLRQDDASYCRKYNQSH